MKLGILGGTFDPIHLGHLLTAETIYDKLHLNRLLFVPAGNPPHKQTIEKTPIQHRWAMVQLAIADNPRFEPCRIDIDRPGPHYSTDTISLIKAEWGCTADDCFFIIGGDSLMDLPFWYNPTALIQLCRLAVVHRPGYQLNIQTLENALPGVTERIDWVEMPLIALASSHVRENIRLGYSIRYQLPDSVREYIIQNQLYKKD